MHLLFLAARIYPFWAVPMVWISAQLAIYFYRRPSRLTYLFWLLVLGFMSSIGGWLYYRGDLHSDDWIRMFISLFQ